MNTKISFAIYLVAFKFSDTHYQKTQIKQILNIINKIVKKKKKPLSFHFGVKIIIISKSTCQTVIIPMTFCIRRILSVSTYKAKS